MYKMKQITPDQIQMNDRIIMFDSETRRFFDGSRRGTEHMKKAHVLQPTNQTMLIEVVDAVKDLIDEHPTAHVIKITWG